MKEKIFYRGNKEIYKQAKSQAALEGISVGEFIDKALQEKLDRKEKR